MIRKSALRGFSLMEVLFTVGVAGISILAILSLLGAARLNNALEQERSRAHQIVSQALEIESFELFTFTHSQRNKTIWDNSTPDDTSDDTVGVLEIEVRDPQNNDLLTTSPDPAVIIQIEATLTWESRGSRVRGTEMRESVMTYKVP